MGTRQKLKSWILEHIYSKTPAHLAANYRDIGEDDIAAVESSLRKYYFSLPSNRMQRPIQEYLESNEGRDDLEDHLTGRLHRDRRQVIPWLDASRPLEGTRILEIGAGTGSATVALAEQNAIVTGLDVSSESLAVAQDRSDAYKLPAKLIQGNVLECKSIFGDQKFDMVILYASLEHMTHEERVQGIRQSWELLTEDGFLCVVETPNRLWAFDHHTARLPFFHWLPDQLAYEYLSRSPRKELTAAYQGRLWDSESKLDFLRRGRGVSYHEFELAAGNLSDFEVVSDLASFWRSSSAILHIRWWCSSRRKFSSYLNSLVPNLPLAFFEPSLDIVMRHR